VQCCYEAGPCGFDLQRALTARQIPCEIIAPALIPRRAGDRIKTDRRDAGQLAVLYRAGALTAIHIPTEQEEAARDLLRCREDIRADLLRARHRLSKFLLRHGLRPGEKIKAWSAKHLAWAKTLRLELPTLEATLLDYLTEVEHACERIARLERAIDQAVESAPATIRAVIDGLQALRGIARVSAATIVAELGQLSRFSRPKQLMGYVGAVPREHSSGEHVRRGAITKTGNAHLRRILVEAAWSYRHRPKVGSQLRRRQRRASEQVKEIAWKAQQRLHYRYVRLMGRSKLKQQVVTAVARELAGFVWAIGVEVEKHLASRPVRAA